MFVERLLNRFFGPVPDKLFYYLTCLEHQEGRNPGDFVAHWRGAVAVDVHFADLDFALIVQGQLFNDGSNGTARSTPGCPEVDQDRSFRLQDILVEIRIVHFNNSVSCHRSSSNSNPTDTAARFRVTTEYPSTFVRCWP